MPGPAPGSARSSGSSSRRRSSARAIVGAGAGGLIGHLRKGISRGDLKEFGDDLENGTAAVVVIGESKLEEQLEKAMKRADKLIAKEIEGDAEELQREIDAAAKEDASEGLRVVPLPPRGPRTRRGPSPPSGETPKTRALPVVAGALVLTGTLFYWRFEDCDPH